MKQTYTGGCHCGAVRYEADIDLDEGTAKCNCSFCTMVRWWGAVPEDFRLLAGEDELKDYQFGSGTIHHMFCRNCGMKVYARGYLESFGGDFYSISPVHLDGLTPSALAELPVEYLDGRNDDWDSAPAETRHL